MDRKQNKISIIIPTFNEEGHISKVLQALEKNASGDGIKEIIVVDGGSTDATTNIAASLGAKILKSSKGRAKQMNLGAKNASGTILYFLHVDSIPPRNFDQNIVKAYEQGFSAGCFRLHFNSKSLFLRFFAWCTCINHILCRGGDQSLYITKGLFDEFDGFDENYTIYEDIELIHRIYKKVRFKIIPNYVITSARRYHERGMITLQYHFGVIHAMYFTGAKPNDLYTYYLEKIAIKKNTATYPQNRAAPLQKSI
ncbi:TIGR04283 family arsenosugar biosynthesis glycosyltransferase [Maribacter sp. CXY002]|uniref:TIGR04283 family arsenosugar biosynthesis glycosyltransferase n=1 Tax=Maribacter luteocoastalis TaxID=3407671 RepID=UPI003B66B4C2